MRAGEAHAPNALDLADRPQQVREQRTHAARSARPPRRQREVTAVGVHVLAEQRDLGDAGGGEPLDLGDEGVERAADLRPPHGRHDAERAGVVASDLDRDPRAVALLALRGQDRRKRGGVIGCGSLEHLDDRPLPTGELDEVRGAMHVVRAEDDIHPRCLRPNDLTVVLGQAAADDDLHVGAPVLDRLQHAQVAVELVVGVLSNAAGVQDDDVRMLGVRGDDESVGFEEPGDALGVVLVHLAPEGADEVRAGHLVRLGAVTLRQPHAGCSACLPRAARHWRRAWVRSCGAGGR